MECHCHLRKNDDPEVDPSSNWTDRGDRVLGRRKCGLALASRAEIQGWVEELLRHTHKEMIVASFARLRFVW